MSSVFNKNAIMTGLVDSFCLACESHLRSDEESILHIAKPVHKKNLDSTSYLEKYKDDRVRKLKKGYYFCELCNLYMTNAAKVGLHVAQTSHIEKKSNQVLKRVNNGVLAFNKVLINDVAWHGLMEDMCAVCNKEFDNANIHKTEMGHLLNLVVNNLEFIDDKFVYRKVDDSSFQCLTCNTLCALDGISDHFKNDEHIELYQRSCTTDKLNCNIMTIKENETIDAPAIQSNGINVTNSQNNNYLESYKEATKTVKEKNVEASKKMLESNKTTEEVGKDRFDNDAEICRVLGAENYVGRDGVGRKWCVLCDWCMEDGAVEHHINSRHHQSLLKMHKERLEINKQIEQKVAEKNDNTIVKDDLKTIENKALILDAADEFQKNGINVKLVENSAYCRKCSKNIDFEYEGMKKHIEQHKNKTAKKETPAHVVLLSGGDPNEKDVETKKTTLFTSPVLVKEKSKDSQNKIKADESRDSSVASKPDFDEIVKFAKDNDLTYNSGHNNAFCRICSTKVPSSLRNLKEHVNGMSHKNKLIKSEVKSQSAKPESRPYISKVRSEDFINEAITVRNIFFHDCILNKKFVVNIHSFFVMTKHDNRLRCQVCEVNVALGDEDSHNKTMKHVKAMADIPVINSLNSEFVREVRPNIFHCGFCNQITDSWENLQNHLKSIDHREAKNSANWRLQEHMPSIIRHNERERMQLSIFLQQMFIRGLMYDDDSD